MASAAIPTTRPKRKNRTGLYGGNESGTHCGAEAGSGRRWRGGNAERRVNQLTSLGIKVMWVDAVSIEQIADTLRQLAARSPQPEKAQQAAQTLLNSTPRSTPSMPVKLKARLSSVWHESSVYQW